MVADDTIRTKALTYTRDHLKEIAAYAVAVASSVVAASVTWGHKQADTEMLSKNVSDLTIEIKSMHGEVRELSDNQIKMSGKLDSVDEKVNDFKTWKDRITGVAETINIPKLAHRAKH